MDYGAHLQGGAAKQYKTINATARLSKAGRENSEPRMAGSTERETSVVTSKKQRSRRLVEHEGQQLAGHVRSTWRGTSLAAPGGSHAAQSLFSDGASRQVQNTNKSIQEQTSALQTQWVLFCSSFIPVKPTYCTESVDKLNLGVSLGLGSWLCSFYHSHTFRSRFRHDLQVKSRQLVAEGRINWGHWNLVGSYKPTVSSMESWLKRN